MRIGGRNRFVFYGIVDSKLVRRNNQARVQPAELDFCAGLDDAVFADGGRVIFGVDKKGGA